MAGRVSSESAGRDAKSLSAADRVYRRAWRAGRSGTNERRPDAVGEVFASSLRAKQGKHHHLLVGVLDGVHDDRLAVSEIGKDLVDPDPAHPPGCRSMVIVATSVAGRSGSARFSSTQSRRSELR